MKYFVFSLCQAHSWLFPLSWGSHNAGRSEKHVPDCRRLSIPCLYEIGVNIYIIAQQQRFCLGAGCNVYKIQTCTTALGSCRVLTRLRPISRVESYLGQPMRRNTERLDRRQSSDVYANPGGRGRY